MYICINKYKYYKNF